MTRLAAQVEGIGILGPGMSGWPGAAAVLAGRVPFVFEPTELPVPEGLPSAERRRLGRVVKLALGAGLQATSQAGVDPTRLPSVFASSGGDGNNCHEICQALSLEERTISPTRFHNSVHNAAAGYWSIATGSVAASNAVCAFDVTFAAGLLEAVTQVVVDRTRVLLVSYDAQYPPPLFAKRPIRESLGVALVLGPIAAGGSRRDAGPIAAGGSRPGRVPDGSDTAEDLRRGARGAGSDTVGALGPGAGPAGSDTVGGLRPGAGSAGSDTVGGLRPGAGPAGSDTVGGLRPGAGPLAVLSLELSDAPPDVMEDAALESLRKSIPAGRGLPLLQSIALRRPSVVHIEYLDGRSLAVEVEPCG